MLAETGLGPPPVGAGLAALEEPADGLDRLQWMLDRGVESVQLPFAARFGLEPATLHGPRWKRFCDLIARFRRPVLHAPFHSVADVTFISPSLGIVEGSLEELETALAIASEACIADVVVHSGRKVYWMTDAEAAGILRVSLPRLNDLAERYGVTLAMETAEWLNASPEHLRVVAEARMPRVRLCLDIGHLMTREGNHRPLKGFDSVESLIAEFGPLTTVVHIHDTDGKEDHKPLGEDKGFRCRSVVEALRRARFGGPFIQELAPKNLSHDRLLASCRYLEGLVRAAYT